MSFVADQLGGLRKAAGPAGVPQHASRSHHVCSGLQLACQHVKVLMGGYKY